MPTLPVYDQSKKKISDINLDDRVFDVPLKKHLIYEAVVAYQRNLRQGTASTKTRAEVRGGGKKPFRQKGTGRARQGSSRDSHQVGGGVTFGPRPRAYGYDLPKKIKEGALRTTLSEKCREGALTVLKDLQLEKVKTKNLNSLLKNFEVSQALIVDLPNKNLEKSAANLMSFKVVRPEHCLVYDLLKFKHLFITEPAVLDLEKRLQP